MSIQTNEIFFNRALKWLTEFAWRIWTGRLFHDKLDAAKENDLCPWATTKNLVEVLVDDSTLNIFFWASPGEALRSMFVTKQNNENN